MNCNHIPILFELNLIILYPYFFRRYSWRLLKRRFNCYSLHFSCFGFISHCSTVFAFGPNIVETILKSFGSRKPRGLGAFRSSWRWTGTRFGYAKIIHTFLQVSFFRLPNKFLPALEPNFPWNVMMCMYRVSHSEVYKVNQLWGVEGSIILLNYGA